MEHAKAISINSDHRLETVALGSILLASLAFAVPAFADTSSAGAQAQGGWGAPGQRMMAHRAPGVFGTVASISGSTLTVTSTMPPRFDEAQQGGANTPTPTTYTVQASGATVTKDGASASLGDIAVGDTVMVEGTVNAADVTATAIRDGLPPQGQGQRGARQGQKPGMGAAASIQGTGEPVVAGAVSAVNGSTLSLSTAAGTAYSVDASSATVVKQGATSTVSAIASGDRVVVQGSVEGSNVTASSVIDQGAAPAASSGGASGTNAPAGPHGFGFFGMLGGLLHNLFGFF